MDDRSLPAPLDVWHRLVQKKASTVESVRQAVADTQMSKEQHDAAYDLFEEHRGDIRAICQQQLSRAKQSPAARHIDLDDVMQSAYVLFLRALVRYEPTRGPLGAYLWLGLRWRVRNDLRRSSTKDRPSVSADPRGDVDLHIDVRRVARDLLEAGHLDAGADLLGDSPARRTWRRLQCLSST